MAIQVVNGLLIEAVELTRTQGWDDVVGQRRDRDVQLPLVEPRAQFGGDTAVRSEICPAELLDRLALLAPCLRLGLEAAAVHLLAAAVGAR
jgi:hypothetical protein